MTETLTFSMFRVVLLDLLLWKKISKGFFAKTREPASSFYYSWITKSTFSQQNERLPSKGVAAYAEAGNEAIPTYIPFITGFSPLIPRAIDIALHQLLCRDVSLTCAAVSSQLSGHSVRGVT